ncbi:MAG: hypothetical protein AB9842_09990 [Bacteroidales bacterium]
MLKNSGGLVVNLLENGLIESMESGPVRIGLNPVTSYSKSGPNIYLRTRGRHNEFTALLGPESNSVFIESVDGFVAKGSWKDLEYTCTLQLSEESSSWQWQVELLNSSGSTLEIDLVCVQDVGLKQASGGLMNEYYVSQYIERHILTDDLYGPVICCRQNMKEAGGHPWMMLACKNGAASASTDGMLFYGRTFRETAIPEGLTRENPGGESAGESSVVAIQESPFWLEPGGRHNSKFVAAFLADHPQATSAADLQLLPGLMDEFKEITGVPDPSAFSQPVRNLFNSCTLLPAEDLSEEELLLFFGAERRHSETENGRLLSFFCKQNNAVMLRAKEILAERPHGHIMQARSGYRADESIVSTTAFAFGVFNSQLTQGNTNFNILLSVCASAFNLMPENGQRIFVETGGQRFLLGVPSAFETGLNHCRWIYKSGDSCFQVRTWTSKQSPRVNTDFKVLSGPEVKLLITHQFDVLNPWSVSSGHKNNEFIVKPDPQSMIAGKFPSAQFRILINTEKANFQTFGSEILYDTIHEVSDSLFVIKVDQTHEFCLSFIGEICGPVTSDEIESADAQCYSDCQDAQEYWKDLSMKLLLNGGNKHLSAIQEILPWFGMNAITHFLTPHGLEQFGGAAWGTRDVAQGPFDLLLHLQKYEEARFLLLTIFSHQDPDGGWPQWWMFDSYSAIRADSSHGDIFYWCIIALSNYIMVSGDLQLLDEVIPYFAEDPSAGEERTPLREHLDRLIDMIISSFIPGTALVPFGGGDWNDSLQPVSKSLAQRMISSWTVEMNYQAFSSCLEVYELSGDRKRAGEMKRICEKIRSDFNTYLVKDGVVAGYGLVEDDGNINVLLHPTDQQTHIHYSILPMNRGIISGIFTREQAEHHQDIIEKYLKGPDGARLMDKPLQYKGGIQSIFQRAESSTFFGREIGLMYIHEHIRYAESLAITGKAEAFILALRQANPVGYRDIVPCGDIRQSNCYYSSSDVTFKNRYEADERYDEIKTGAMTLKGGWRVYSSGPGIYISLIISRMLGLRVGMDTIILDPVLPFSMDGLTASLEFLGKKMVFRYLVRKNCFSPDQITINGKAIKFTMEDNPYRKGGAVMLREQFLSRLDQDENIVEIIL